jgi:hypothetical protein
MTPESRDVINTIRAAIKDDHDARAALLALEGALIGEAGVRRDHFAYIATLQAALRDCGQALEDALEYCRWPAGRQNLDAIVERGNAARALAIKVLAP